MVDHGLDISGVMVSMEIMDILISNDISGVMVSVFTLHVFISGVMVSVFTLSVVDHGLIH